MFAQLASLTVYRFRRHSTTLFLHIYSNQGNEGVDVKEGSIDNIIEDNNIYMQLDAESGGALRAVWE